MSVTTVSVAVSISGNVAGAARVGHVDKSAIAGAMVAFVVRSCPDRG